MTSNNDKTFITFFISFLLGAKHESISIFFYFNLKKGSAAPAIILRLWRLRPFLAKDDRKIMQITAAKSDNQFSMSKHRALKFL